MLKRIIGRRAIIACSLVILALALAFHRTPNQPFRPFDNKCLTTSLLADCGTFEELDGAEIAYVEFDDQGSYFDQNQAFLAYSVLRSALDEPKKEVDVYVFVHGWQNNASPDNSNVTEFKQFLAAKASENTDHRTIGIFVGWPGETLRFPLNGLTFWSRKAAAHRVAAGSAQEFFATLNQIKQDHLMVEPKSERLKIYIIGHSFGGLIAFQANSSAYALRYGLNVRKNRGAPRVEELGDLMVLINPAIEAERFSSLHSLSLEYPNDPFYAPTMVTIGSKTDIATRYLFPIGVALGTFTTNQLRGQQWQDSFVTVANSARYMTHEASLKSEEGVAICEVSHTRRQRKAPFWFISADASLIDGHSDLNSAKLLALFTTIQRHVSERRVGGLSACRNKS